MVLEEVRNKLSVNDCISFQGEGAIGFGIITKDRRDAVEVIMFEEVTSDLYRRFSLRPVAFEEYPMAYYGGMTELVATVSNKVTIPRSSIRDIIFILPIKEVESAMFHMAGSKVAYFIRYYLDADQRLHDYGARFYLDQYVVEPFSHRIFSSMNLLAQHLRKALHHLKETESCSKTFRAHFSMESFVFLSCKLPSAIHVGTMRKESSIIYFNNLSMEARSGTITKYFLRVLHVQSMSELRKLLGGCVGLGLTTTRPTKKIKHKYCTINGILNSVEVSEELPREVVDSPFERTGCDGIDFVYKAESRQLVCTIRFTKLCVSSTEIATARVPSADVKAPTSSAYIGAWFIHNGAVLEVVAIVDDYVNCKTPDNDEEVIQLPLPLVIDLINKFGR